IVSFCNIGPAGANLPSKAIMANGKGYPFFGQGIISNNNIFDFFLPDGDTSGICIFSGDSFIISDNRIYQTAPRTFTTTGAGYTGITVIDITQKGYFLVT